MSVNQGPSILQLPCLGRPFCLGMLYDCRSDTLIPGMKLWDKSELEKDVEIRSQQTSDISIIGADTIDSKSSALDIKASLKLSFLGGLVSVSGSAKYLDDRKSSSHQSRLTMKYKCTTEFRELTMSHLGEGKIKHPLVIDKLQATHVVTGILYGAQAFLVFDKLLTDEEMRKDIEGDLHVMVKAIPSFRVDGEGSLKMSEDDKKKVDKFEVKFYGDFVPSVNPTSYAEAVKLYKDLPQQLGPNNEKAVPVAVYLYPLEHLDTKAAKLVREISTSLVSQTQESIEGLHSLSRRCNYLENTPACRNFPVIRNKVVRFHEMVKEYQGVFKNQLMPILPKIRGGGAEESELVQVIRQREASPFSHSLLTQWLDNCEGLIKVMGTYITSMAPVKFASEHGDLLAETMNPEYMYCVSFTTQLNTKDLLAIAMKEYLRNCDDASYRPDPVSISDISLFDSVNDDMGVNANNFINFYRANTGAADVTFIVADDKTESDQPGASIHLYERGKLIDKNLKPPSAPGLPHAKRVAHNELTIGWPQPNTGSENVTHYRISCKTFDACDWVVSNTADATTTHVVQQLRPFTPYQVKVEAVCKAGTSYNSAVHTITTRQTNPPGKQNIWKASASKIGIDWTRPSIVGETVTITSYDIEKCLMSRQGEEEWICCESTKDENLSCTIRHDFQVPTMYRVIANCGGQTSLPSETINADTIDNSERILKEVIREKSLKFVDSINPSIYQVKLTKLDGGSRVYKLHFGKPRSGETEKVVLLIGATGAGKTTFINGIFNYIIGVEWNDSFRFRLVDIEGHSEAQLITAYTLHHRDGFRVPYTLTLIDTPGFGDTIGTERDKKIFEQLKQFFSTKTLKGVGGFERIDSIGLMAPASSPNCVKLVVDYIRSHFGKDVGENITPLICDSRQTPVPASVMETELRFSNSALYASHVGHVDDGDSVNDDDEGRLKEKCWQMNINSFKKFFENLNTVRGKSFHQTCKVLALTVHLEKFVRKIQREQAELDTTGDQLKTELASLDSLKEHIENYNSRVTLQGEKREQDRLTENMLERFFMLRSKHMTAESKIKRIIVDFTATQEDILTTSNPIRLLMNKLQIEALCPNPLLDKCNIDILMSAFSTSWDASVEALRRDAETMKLIEVGNHQERYQGILDAAREQLDNIEISEPYG